MANVITIKAGDEYRNHLRIVLTYILIHFDFNNIGELPLIGIEKVLEQSAVRRVVNRLNACNPNKTLNITLTDTLVYYSCYVCMNKILVSKYDERITSIILEDLPDDHDIKTFKAFRNQMLSINSYLIRQLEDELPTQKKLFILKDRLAEIEID